MEKNKILELEKFDIEKKIQKIFKKLQFNYSESYNHKLVTEFRILQNKKKELGVKV